MSLRVSKIDTLEILMIDNPFIRPCEILRSLFIPIKIERDYELSLVHAPAE
jgi:hypothetical protein